MNVFMTGATGMTGSFLTEALIERGCQLKALVRSTSDVSLIDTNRVMIVKGDIAEEGTWMESVEGSDVVFHLAALMKDWGPREEFMKHNVVGTENVLKAVKKYNARKLIYVSTRSVMGMGQCLEADETWPYQYSNEYGYSKMVAEQKVLSFYKETKIQTIIFRPSWIIGPRDRYSVSSIIALVKTGKPILINNGEVKQSFIHPKDVVQALIKAMEKEDAAGQICLIDSGERRTMRELFECFARELGVHIEPRNLPYWKAKALGTVLQWIAKIKKSTVSPPLTPIRAKILGLHHTYNIDKARKELGFSPNYSLEQMVTEAVSWWKEKQKDIKK